MNKLRIMLLALLVATFSFSTLAVDPGKTLTANKVALVATIKKAKKILPKQMEGEYTVTSLKYDDPNVVFTFEGNFNKEDFKYLQENQQQVYDHFLAQLRDVAIFGNVIKQCKGSKSNILFVFMNKEGQNYTINVPYQNL